MPRLNFVNQFTYVELAQHVQLYLVNDDDDVSTNANVDGSSTPATFSYVVPQGFDFMMESTTVNLVDVSGAFAAGVFAGFVASLTNGPPTNRTYRISSSDLITRIRGQARHRVRRRAQSPATLQRRRSPPGCVSLG